MQEKVILISDHIGRLVAGRVSDETDTTLTMLNPIIIENEVQQNGQIAIHAFPYMFIEFTLGGESTHTWTFNKSSIVISDVVIEDRMRELVLKINQPKQAVAPQGNAKIVNLFGNE